MNRLDIPKLRREAPAATLVSAAEVILERGK
jgi:hypothetical protein